MYEQSRAAAALFTVQVSLCWSSSRLSSRLKCEIRLLMYINAFYLLTVDTNSYLMVHFHLLLTNLHRYSRTSFSCFFVTFQEIPSQNDVRWDDSLHSTVIKTSQVRPQKIHHHIDHKRAANMFSACFLKRKKKCQQNSSKDPPACDAAASCGRTAKQMN